MNTISSDKLIKKIESLSLLESKNELGQIFTPEWIAEIMVYYGIKNGDENCIDPCFGEGIFIEKISNCKQKKFKGSITGIEIDKKLYNNFIKPKDANLNLLLGNFFDYNNDFNSYDFAIMNPPYIRQEKLVSSIISNEINKEKLIRKISRYVGSEFIDKKANLYYYFLLYITQFLKNNGVLSAITYNSWLSTKFGQKIQKYLLENYKIKYIIDFDKDSFSDAMIGSCIMVLEKNSSKKIRDNNMVNFLRLKSKITVDQIKNITGKDKSVKSIYSIKQKELYNETKWEKFLNLPQFHTKLIKENDFVPLEKFSNIKRGLGSISTRYFIVDKSTIKKFDIPYKYLIPILKDIKKINRKGDSYHYLLSIDKIVDNKDKIFRYLDYIKKDVLKNNNKSKTLRSNINKRDDWYSFKLNKDFCEIFFNYIIRLNKTFYCNDSLLVTDNFYMLNSKKDISVNILLSILNSSITKYFLEFYGRTQGNGLLKIQVYELNQLPVINIEILKNKDLKKLEELGKQLTLLLSKKLDTKNVINEIDQIIFSNISEGKFTSHILEYLKKIEHERISRK